MRKLYAFLIALVLPEGMLTQNNCNKKGVDSRIIGGVETDAAKYPFYAALVTAGQLKSKSGKLHVSCGASLVTSNKLLTAAHCYEDGKQKPRNWMSQYSAVFRLRERCNRVFESSSPIIHVQVHPQYSTETINNDIAVATLKDNVNLEPICLAPPGDNGISKSALIIGYGNTVEQGPNSSPCKLNAAVIKIYSKKECLKTNVARSLQRISRVLCAGVESGSKDGCQGDSGGPMVRLLNNNTLVLQGITSFGIGCGRANTPGVYTDVSGHRKWIDENLKRVIKLRPVKPSSSGRPQGGASGSSGLSGSNVGVQLPGISGSYRPVLSGSNAGVQLPGISGSNGPVLSGGSVGQLPGIIGGSSGPVLSWINVGQLPGSSGYHYVSTGGSGQYEGSSHPMTVSNVQQYGTSGGQKLPGSSGARPPGTGSSVYYYDKTDRPVLSESSSHKSPGIIVYQYSSSDGPILTGSSGGRLTGSSGGRLTGSSGGRLTRSSGQK